ncbi:AfsR/SARP family transcriptional regulator [Streptomyces sp. NPDC089424]|uniref:AfsR/SARP family transcriptional regulator n=1 Tax=Streptomyces sp. NPDC089424 TaxID=3365917 RepID=UPI00381BD7A4
MGRPPAARRGGRRAGARRPAAQAPRAARRPGGPRGDHDRARRISAAARRGDHRRRALPSAIRRRLSAEGHAAAASDPDRAATLLERALSLWRGPALADCRGGPICTAKAYRLEEQRPLTLEAFYDARLRSARPDGITGDLELPAEEHPLRERFADLLMVALQRAGRHCEALAVYDRVRRRLASELGASPGPLLRGRREALLRHGPPPGPLAKTELREVRGVCGVHGVRRVCGVCGEGLGRGGDVAYGDPALKAAEMARIGRRLEELFHELRDLNRRFGALKEAGHHAAGPPALPLADQAGSR